MNYKLKINWIEKYLLHINGRIKGSYVLIDV